ncbi:magnesium chelatase family protein [Fluviicoccus keumensis]|uniref:Magnesium chelatase family protein n=1 Tax=Fluviicoccus keumensis TaxID=1435465 RepID=A0A4Q7YN37_9GAMM|nr:YifB family Mg chelatase-like AAA ATPase [Fluviicoccus keumensis]RZU38414.1 magnesium chelatase family protein [Fluviicoccus keumensis]
MSLALVRTRAAIGLSAPLVTVEVHQSNGLPALTIVGLPEAAVRESKDRVRSALLNAGFEFPQRRLTINLAPADLPKEGGRYDLPIALGILAASGQIPAEALEDREFVGELALAGELRGVPGVLSASLAAGRENRALFVPAENAGEAARPPQSRVFGAACLGSLCAHLQGDTMLPRATPSRPLNPVRPADLADVKGQHRARRALEIAAAGGHSLLMMGPPGTGKTLLASRLPGILPELDEAASLEVATIHSVAGQPDHPLGLPPFRAPHHTASAAALVGGGSNPRPGEITLAHHGVLFLDELPEFDRKVLEVLREPLESGHVVISRAARQTTFPAGFQLVAAMNPCPCGYLGDGSPRCRCTPEQVGRYRGKLSGPLLDRIDLHIEVPALPAAALRDAKPGEDSAAVRERVLAARARQQARQGATNRTLSPAELDRHCVMGEKEARLLEQAMQRLRLSARAYHRVLRVARTIADLAGSESLQTAHLTEAITFRLLDRQ